MGADFNIDFRLLPLLLVSWLGLVAFCPVISHAQTQATGRSEPQPFQLPSSIEDSRTPEIVLIAPVVVGNDSVTVNQSTIQLQGRVSAANKIASFTIDFRKIPLDPNGQFDTELTLRLGRNVINITAQDSSGTTIQKAIDIYFEDEAPPSIIVYEPPPKNPGEIGQISNLALIRFRGQVADENPVSTFTISGTEVTLDEENRFDIDVDLVDGINTISLVAIDALGNVAEDSVKVIRESAFEVSSLLLSDLSFSSGFLEPLFSPFEQFYSLTVESSTEAVSLTPTVYRDDPVLVLSGTGFGAEKSILNSGSPSPPIPLSVGSNEIVIELSDVAGDTSFVYHIAVTREQ